MIIKAFRSENYLNDVLICQLWLEDLIERRENIRVLNDETSMKLKKQVYLNYRQFIEAAREISALESEMFRINHILQPRVQYLPVKINRIFYSVVTK